MVDTQDKEYSDLHPLTQLLGTIGALMFGGFGGIYLVTLVTIIPTLPLLLHASLLGLVLFIAGALTIPLLHNSTETTPQ